MEYFTPARPGIAAREEKTQIEQMLATRDENHARMRERGESDEKILRLETLSMGDFYEQKKNRLVELDEIIAEADADEDVLQEIDYMVAAAKNFAEQRRRFLAEMYEHIEPLIKSDPTEAERLINLIPDDFDTEKEALLLSITSESPEIVRAIRERDEEYNSWSHANVKM